MNPRNQSKKSRAHADMDKEHNTADLSTASATMFRTCVGVLMYLENDVPHAQGVIRHLATYSLKFKVGGEERFGGMCAFPPGHVYVIEVWGGDGSCVYHN